MIKKILLLLLFSILLPSAFTNDDSYILNLIFKEINVKSGDKVFFENEEKLVGSVISNKISNHYNIVKVKVSNNIKIPLNSKFEHIFTGSLKKNAINITPANDIGSYKDGEIIIVDFKGIVTICDRVDSVKIIFDDLVKTVNNRSLELKELNENIDLKIKDFYDIKSEIKKLDETYARIDSMVAIKTEQEEKKVRELESQVSLLKSSRDSLNLDLKNITNLYNDYKNKVKNLSELISKKTSEKEALEENVNKRNNELIDVNNKYDIANKKLLDARAQYYEIISFVKENIVVVKEYDIPPKPKNGKTIQQILNTNLPERLRGKYKGYIVIEIFINEKGIIQSINDITSYPDNDISPDIEEVCINEMQSIKWIPATKDNKDTGVSYKVVFNFE